MEDVLDTLREWIRPDAEAFDLGIIQMVLRGVIVYMVAVVVVRFGHKRFMGRNTAFDVLVGIMIGSVFSRGLTGQAPLVPTLFGGAALMLCHSVFAFLAYHIDTFSPLVKGRSRRLVENGEVNKRNMRKSLIGPNDLDEAIRACQGPKDIRDVELAYLERSGNISILPRKQKTRVVEVRVEDGVQTVRLLLE